MIRFCLRLALAASIFGAAAAASLAEDAPCRATYVIPYAEQCAFSHKDLRRNASPQNLAAAFAACDRAQTEAGRCLTSTVRQTHVIALSAMYQAVSNQADIAMFAQQYRVAEALLREKLQVLDAVSRESRAGDRTPAAERSATQSDIADALVGQCMEKALAASSQQISLGKAHRYGDLAALLKRRAGDYQACAKGTTTPAKRAYVQYLSLVALEESGRAAQASGKKDEAASSYADCIAGAGTSLAYAAGAVKGYLKTVGTLCAGRKNGTYRVDEPEPIDREDGKTFKPLTLPK